MSIRVLIVDDEPLACEGIALYLQHEKDIQVIAQCHNGREAIEIIRQQQPDVVFLDINMPRLSGFDVIDHLDTTPLPLFIFLTAYAEFAVQAFTVNALDYLLKPIDPVRLQNSVEKVRQHLHNAALVQQANQLNALSRYKIPAIESSDAQQRIVVKSHGHMHFIQVADILWLQANGDYVDIHTASKTHLVRETMHNLEQQLSNNGFQRIHRSTIVKTSLIIELITTASGDYYVALNSGHTLKLSRHYRERLLQKLQVSD